MEFIRQFVHRNAISELPLSHMDRVVCLPHCRAVRRSTNYYPRRVYLTAHHVLTYRKRIAVRLKMAFECTRPPENLRLHRFNRSTLRNIRSTLTGARYPIEMLPFIYTATCHAAHTLLQSPNSAAHKREQMLHAPPCQGSVTSKKVQKRPHSLV